MTQQNNHLLNNILAKKFPLYSEIDLAKIELSLRSLDRNPQDIQQLLLNLPDSNLIHILVVIFEKNLAELNKRFKDIKCLGAYFCFSVTCNQLTHIGEGFRNHTANRFIAIADLSQMTKKTIKRKKDFEPFIYLALPEMCYHSYLGLFKAVFLPESNHIVNWFFPKHVIRIGCPHGLDIPISDTIGRYGGALVYDYILSPTQIGERDKVNLKVKLPACLNQRATESLGIIPMGFPKLDTFIKRTTPTSEKIKIVYHLSNWLLESKASRDNVGLVLANLVNKFTSAEIIFRPFPGDLCRSELSQQIMSFTHSSKVFISEGTSYIDDYADATLLITHRVHTGQMFTYATGRPIFCLDYNALDSHTMFPLGLIVNSQDELLQKISDYLNKPDYFSKRIELHRQATLLHPGNSMQYLIENLPYILDDKHHPSWEYLEVFNKKSEHISEYLQIIRLLEDFHLKSPPFNHIVEAALLLFPDDPVILYFAAESQSRTPDPFQHNYYFLNRYKALEHACKALLNIEQYQHDFSSRIANWILHKGLYIAHTIKYQKDIGKLDFQHDFDALYARLLSASSSAKTFEFFSSDLAESRLKATFTFDFELLASAPELKHIAELYLYGTGQVAEDFIYLNNKFKRFTIKALFDSNLQKQGQKLLGYDILSNKALPLIKHPIVICSIAFEKEISLMLRNTLADNIEEIVLSNYAGQI